MNVAVQEKESKDPSTKSMGGDDCDGETSRCQCHCTMSNFVGQILALFQVLPKSIDFNYLNAQITAQ
jgi:hypothetical protein